MIKGLEDTTKEIYSGFKSTGKVVRKGLGYGVLGLTLILGYGCAGNIENKNLSMVSNYNPSGKWIMFHSRFGEYKTNIVEKEPGVYESDNEGLGKIRVYPDGRVEYSFCQAGSCSWIPTDSNLKNDGKAIEITVPGMLTGMSNDIIMSGRKLD